jgi:tetratricopeptide (TPR) repeat protein
MYTLKPQTQFLIIPAVIASAMMGCSNFQERSLDGLKNLTYRSSHPTASSKDSESESSKTASQNLTTSGNDRVANPPARTVRFDGNEAILGNGIPSSLSTEDLRTRLKPLLEKEKIRSAKRIILQYGETSERLLAERWTSDAASKDIKLIAALRSKRSNAIVKTDWNSLLRVAEEFPTVAQEYQRQRNAFVLALQTIDPDEQTAIQLKNASTAVGHPIVEMDCLRLLGLRAVVAEQWSTADSLYRQALAVALRSGNLQYQADLSLLLAEAAKRNNPTSDSVRTSGLIAISNQIEIMRRDSTLDIEFWLRIEQVIPDLKTWPENFTEAFEPHVKRTLVKNVRSPNVLFWSAIAQAQIDRTEMQLALLNLKKAETLATGDDVFWLRIAESKCLAGIGQPEAAVAILSGPATSPQPAIASAAIAALGSVKLQLGAYQQGAKLLNKSLQKSPDLDWPSKNQAMADLAIAQLIIGGTDQGLESMHEAQSRFQASDDLASLIQSLENELRLLDHEGRKGDSSAVQERIALVEAS